MQQNYFTGEFSSNKTGKNQTKSSTQNQTEIKSQPTVKSQDQNQPQNLQPNNVQQPCNQNFMNVEELVIDQLPQQQKLIQNNTSQALAHKKSGNQHYTQKNYSQALQSYTKSLQYTDTLSQQNNAFRSVLYSNIGLTHMKMNNDQRAIEYFQQSLKLVIVSFIQNENYVKARTNLALAYQNTGKIQQALEQYKKVLETAPNDVYVRQRVGPLEGRVKQLQEKRKDQVIGGLKNIGNSILGYFGMSLDNFKLQQGPGGGYNVQYKQ